VNLAESDCIVSFGADLVSHHEVAGFMAKRNIPNGTKIILVDSNQNELAKWAELILKPSKGISESFVNELKAAKIQIDSGTLKENDPVSHALLLITNAAKPVFVVDKSIDANTMSALVEFAGMVGAEIVGLKGGANGLAAAQYQLDRPFKVTEQQIGYYILGDEEPTNQLVKEAEKTTFKVVQASYTSQLSANADVVFPVANYLEEEGHFVNFEGKTQQTHKSLNAPEGVWTNFAVLEAITKKLALKAKSDWKEALTKQISPVTLQV
jgi:predicted molibdopterin-dependent oxidoreductase YjgC